MHLLYLDESGNSYDSVDRHFVLAGLAVFERTVHHLTEDIDRLQARHFPGTEPMEFHASPIRSGSGRWRRVERTTRTALLSDIGIALARERAGVALFGTVVEKTTGRQGEDAIKTAIEDLTSRFNIYLKRKAREHDDQRGIVVFAESRYQKLAKLWMRDFKQRGTRWQRLNRICDIPYFASTADSRPLQLADYIAHALFLQYERDDETLSSRLFPRFDRHGGVTHGLAHLRGTTDVPCVCLSCSSKRPTSAG